MEPKELIRLLMICNNHLDSYDELPNVSYCMTAMGDMNLGKAVSDTILQLHLATGLERSREDRLDEAEVLGKVLDSMEALEEADGEPDEEWLADAIKKAEDDMPN